MAVSSLGELSQTSMTTQPDQRIIGYFSRNESYLKFAHSSIPVKRTAIKQLLTTFKREQERTTRQIEEKKSLTRNE